MEFETQKALLEYLGKCPDDRKLVKRMIGRGEVYKKDGMYYLVDNFKKKATWDLYDEIRELKDRVKELEKSDLEFAKPRETRVYNVDVERLEEQIRELNSDLDFQIKENEKLEADKKRYQNSIRESFYFVNDVCKYKIDWYKYKATIKLEWDIEWEDNQ